MGGKKGYFFFLQREKANMHRNMTFTFMQNDQTFATAEYKVKNKEQ